MYGMIGGSNTEVWYYAILDTTLTCIGPIKPAGKLFYSDGAMLENMLYSV